MCFSFKTKQCRPHKIYIQNRKKHNLQRRQPNGRLNYEHRTSNDDSIKISKVAAHSPIRQGAGEGGY